MTVVSVPCHNDHLHDNLQLLLVNMTTLTTLMTTFDYFGDLGAVAVSTPSHSDYIHDYQ